MDNQLLSSIISDFDKFGILPHTLPNAIGLWPNEQECLVWTALKANPNYDFLEIGSFCGGSTVLLALVKKFTDVKTKVVAVDNNFNPMFDFNVFTRGKFQNVVYKLNCNSLDIITYYNNKVSFIFLDGYHSFQMIMKEFRLLQKIMTDDCIIAFHDTSPKILEYDTKTINNIYDYTICNYDILMSDDSQNFRIDEAVAIICKEYGYTIINIPVRDGKTHFKETRLNEWVRGTTSPYNAFTAIRRHVI